MNHFNGNNLCFVALAAWPITEFISRHCLAVKKKAKRKMQNTMTSRFSRVKNEMISSPFSCKRTKGSRKNGGCCITSLVMLAWKKVNF